MFYLNVKMLHNVMMCFVLGRSVDGPAVHWLWADLQHYRLRHLLALQLGFSLHPTRSSSSRYAILLCCQTHTHSHNVIFPNAANRMSALFQKKVSKKQRSHDHVTQSREWSPSKLDRSLKVKVRDLYIDQMYCRKFSQMTQNELKASHFICFF